MTKFIKLTECLSRGDTKIILINTAHVIHFQGGLNGGDTHVRMVDCHNGKPCFYFVQETVAQIWEQIDERANKVA